MSDPALNMLREKINQQHAVEALWLVDENLSAEMLLQVSPRENLSLLTNRYDIYERAQSLGFNITINDFNFCEKRNVRHIYYRVSKEKAIVHHVINCALQLLPQGGELFLCGHKKEGIKTYVDKVSKVPGISINKKRGAAQSMLGVAQWDVKPVAGEKEEDRTEYLEDKKYTDFIRLPGDPSLYSKPGVYGFNKIDQGSAFLVEHLDEFISSRSKVPTSIVDLGCGYGYISWMAASQTGARIIAIDNNVAAVTACTKNFQELDIVGEVVLDDCGNSVKEQVDVVLCNPPFHLGFEVDRAISDKFLKSSRRLLNAQGSALFVVNSFIALEKKARGIYSSVSTLADNGRFKLVVLEA